MAEKNEDPYETVFYPYVTEKTMSLVERENKLEFVVRKTATKSKIKKAVEKILEVKVDKVTTRITKDGKRAIVTLKKGYLASDIGMRLGVI